MQIVTFEPFFAIYGGRMRDSCDTSRTLVCCAQALDASRRLLVITGAGISAECGMPTYRGPFGLYSTGDVPFEILSEEGFIRDPSSVWLQIDQLRVLAARAKLGSAHKILAKWEQSGRFVDFLIATQNIDGLHQQAGNSMVSELHGSLWQLARPRDMDYSEDPCFSEDLQLMAFPEARDEILQRWSEENQRMIWVDRTVPFTRIPPSTLAGARPNVLLYGEGYDDRLLWVEDFIERLPDTLLVVGCSGGASILERLVRRCMGRNPACRIININPHEDCIDQPHIFVPTTASTAMEKLDQLIDQ